MNKLFEQLIDMSAASCQKNLTWDQLKQWVDVSGYDGLTLLRAQGPATTYVASHAAEWQSIYLRRSYFSIDPTAALAKRQRGLAPWVMGKLSKVNCVSTKAMCSQAAAYGIRSGFSIPVSIGFGHFVIFSLYSNSTAEPDVSKLDPLLLTSAVTHLHRSLRLPSDSHVKPRLRPSEVQCLRWASEGKSMRETADLVGVPYSTARFFVDRAKEALGAVSLPQATALAKEFELI